MWCANSFVLPPVRFSTRLGGEVELFEGDLVGLVVGRELGDLVQERVDRQLRADGEGGVVDPLSGHGADGPGSDEDLPVGVGE